MSVNEAAVVIRAVTKAKAEAVEAIAIVIRLLQKENRKRRKNSLKMRPLLSAKENLKRDKI